MAVPDKGPHGEHGLIESDGNGSLGEWRLRRSKPTITGDWRGTPPYRSSEPEIVNQGRTEIGPLAAVLMEKQA